MHKNIVHFEVSSPDQLLDALSNYENSEGVQFAEVSVFGPQVLTQQFSFPESSKRNLALGLTFEASEILSTGSSDLDLAYQIMHMDDEGGVRGVFSAIPSGLAMEYLDCFQSSPLIPVSLKASAVSAVESFLKENPSIGGSYCLVHFLEKQAVNIVMFVDRQPVFFRELYDLNDSDYQDKITDTIRYSCSRSASKKVDQIFFSGDLKNKEALIDNLKKLGKSSAQTDEIPAEVAAINFERLNLFNKYVFSFLQYRGLLTFFTFVLSAAILFSIFFAWQMFDVRFKSSDSKVNINVSEYEQAKDLQEQIRRLNNAP